MPELVYDAVSKSVALSVWVRVPPGAPYTKGILMIKILTGIGLIILGWFEVLGVVFMVGAVLFLIMIILGLLLNLWDWIKGRRK